MGVDLHDIRYVRIGTDNIDDNVRFATKILGLELVRREVDAVYLRGDNRDHNIAYVRSRSSGHVAGFELPSMQALDSAAAEFERCKIQVRHGTADELERRRVGGLITIQDPTGNVIDLVARPAASGRRYFGSRDAGITSFSHIGLRTNDPTVDENFWTTMLNAKVSDRIGDAALLRIDDVHHKIALFPSSFPGIQHVNFQVESHDDVMRSYYFLKRNNVKIVFGPGRHPTSGARFRRSSATARVGRYGPRARRWIFGVIISGTTRRRWVTAASEGGPRPAGTAGRRRVARAPAAAGRDPAGHLPDGCEHR